MNWSRPASDAAHARELEAAGRRECETVKLVDVDADREGARVKRPSERGNRAAAHRAIQRPGGVLLEAAEVLGRLEPDEVMREQRAHQLFLGGQRGEYLGRRKWRVQEKPDALARAELAQFLRERQQLEIVHPDEVIRLQQLVKRERKAAVDAPVSVELAALEARQVDAEMQERPQAVVAEAAVVPVQLLLRQVERSRA